MGAPERKSRDAILEQARASYTRRAWATAQRELLQADELGPLERGDLERLVWSAAFAGQDAGMISGTERLYQAELDAGEPARAARWAFWAGMRLTAMGEPGRASGWLSRAQRLVEELGRDCVERGYLLLPVIHRQLALGEREAAVGTAKDALAIAERFGDRDLAAFARNLQGKSLILVGRATEGMALLDEAMVAVAAGELSPQVTGLTYCSVIAACSAAFEFHRMREWTDALTEWCREQPELGGFSGICLVHRSEVMQLSGAWHEAIEEARHASERLSGRGDGRAAADAAYQEGEIHRLRGELTAAEDGYRRASELGRDPQPGLALLRLQEGKRDVAAASLKRALSTTPEPLKRARLLPASLEIDLATDNLEGARESCRELEELVETQATEVLSALATQARGALELAEGHAERAIEPLRAAFDIWQRYGAPYLAARIRVLLGRAYLSLGDDDTAELELGAARGTLERMGARPDLLALDALRTRATAPGAPPAHDAHGLTVRELEVLRHVAAGKTNKAIAKELFLSEKTVDRHVSNIFTKLGVATRAAATAFAYENSLVGA